MTGDSGPLDRAVETEIAEAEFFRALSPEQMARVRPQLRRQPIRRGVPLFFEGGPAEALWLLQRGEVRLYKSSADGTITTLETLGSGRVFGALSALEEDGYPASAEGSTDGLTWRLPRAVFMRLLSEDPRLGLEVVRIISARLREAHDQLRSFSHDPAPARLARALLRAMHEGEAHVTRRALAESSGTTVETAIRVLRRLEHEGIVRSSVRLVRVVDEPALRRLAGER
ncbi:MAG TPA: Crp/Fnr family transcriptional regulator [Myxococcota bacterium]|nr:Crp/Fnr family transcriptional regulator [Myxococcota bacterium]